MITRKSLLKTIKTSMIKQQNGKITKEIIKHE